MSQTELSEISLNCDSSGVEYGIRVKDEPDDPDPDSTIQERDWSRKLFTEGEDILVHDQDGLIYFGIVVEVDPDIKQCLVRYGGKESKLSSFTSQHLLPTFL